MRVNAQLVDAETGAHLWADRFEETLPTCSSCRTRWWRVANALDYELVRAEAETGAHSKNPDVVDLVMRGEAA